MCKKLIATKRSFGTRPHVAHITFGGGVSGETLADWADDGIPNLASSKIPSTL